MRPKPLGAGLALAAFLLLALAMHSLLRVANCTGPCEDSGWLVLGLPFGIVAGLAAAFAGGFSLGVVPTFTGLGIGSLWAGFEGGEIAGFAFAFGAAFTVAGLLPVALVPVGRRLRARRSRRAQEIMATGIAGTATITEVRDTGITINDDPRVEIHVRIDPRDGSPSIERQRTRTVSRVAIPRAGDRFPVFFMPDDPDRWIVAGEDTPPRAL